MRNLLALALTSLIGLQTMACATDPSDESGDFDTGGKEDSFNVKWNKDIANIVPKNVHNYLERYQWGDYHLIFHMARKSQFGGQRIRNWLEQNSDEPSEDQEGSPRNGIIFLTMHHAMIEHLRERWGDEPVTTDPDGRDTFSKVLDGWQTDDEVLAGIAAAGGDVTDFKKACAKLKPERFESLDDYGNFLQTSLALTNKVDPNDSSVEIYERRTVQGVGIHNELHGIFQDDSSPITVGDPAVNLSNIMFWRIHGWIEHKLQEYLAAKPLAGEELELYNEELERFELHMQLHSDYAETHEHLIPKPSPSLHKEMNEKAFANDVDCADVAQGVKLEGCIPAPDMQ